MTLTLIGRLELLAVIGVGMLANGGDCADCDYGDAADRIAYQGRLVLGSRGIVVMSGAGENPVELSRPQGLDHIIGPKGFTPFDGLGLLVQGFEHRPAFGQLHADVIGRIQRTRNRLGVSGDLDAGAGLGARFAGRRDRGTPDPAPLRYTAGPYEG